MGRLIRSRLSSLILPVVRSMGELMSTLSRTRLPSDIEVVDGPDLHMSSPVGSGHAEVLVGHPDGFQAVFLET